MAFGTELQGRTSHEALLAVQDAEIRLLEYVKKCVTLRIKCDREYAASLSSITNSAQKQDSSSPGTPFSQVWTKVLGETESLAQLMRDNADKLCTNTLESIIRLISEKKMARKVYADERTRLDQELARLQTEVTRLQSDYERRLSKVTQNKNKYNDLCKRGKPGPKLDELQAKYVDSETKLHNLHNDYVIAVEEVNVYQKHYSCILLPSLLEFQQKKQETLVQHCKDMLLEYSNLTDCSTEAFQLIHANIRCAVESINPALEYRDFLQQNRTEPVQFNNVSFCSELLNNFTGTLLPGEIALDDLTVDTVKQKWKLLNDDLDRSKQHVASKNSEIENNKKECADDDGSSANKNTHLAAVVRRPTLEQLRRELLEQQCFEEKYESLASLLGEPLKMLGSDAAPAALTDLTDTTADGESSSSNYSQQQSVSSASSALASIQHGFKTMRTIAKRVRRPAPATVFTPPIADGSGDTATPAAPALVANGRLDSNSRTAQDAGSAVQRASQAYSEMRADAVSTSDGYQQELVQKFGQKFLKMCADVRQFAFASEDVAQLPLHPGHILQDEDWFHGVLPRDEVQRLLVDDGDYLVRESINKKTNKSQYVLSVMWESHKHFIIQESEGGWRFEGESYPTIQDLILQQHKSRQPVTRKSEAILKRPILRPDWELRNDDIELHQKIGSGQFGEVFRGTFRLTGEEVAIKTCRENLSDDVKRKFLQEGRILKQYDHPNIVRFIGIAAQRHPVMIVMEYVSGGSLLTFLRKQGPKQSLKTVIKMGEDAAAGMAYLESRNCLHRDLAARNCLVDSDTAVKISDFGMSREEQEYVVSGGLKQIPIKWTAPEALNYGTYTSACDVWSYGVLLWEIFAFGNQPYPGLTNSQAREKVDEGYRMPPPENTPEEVYHLMMRCWDQEPKNRPHFDEVHRELSRIRAATR